MAISGGLDCLVLAVPKSGFDELVALVKQQGCWSWPAVFSCNFRGEVWGPTGYGRTPEGSRVYLHGRNKLLDEVVRIYLGERPEGGRFFVSESGAHMVPQGCPQRQFVAFIVY